MVIPMMLMKLLANSNYGKWIKVLYYSWLSLLLTISFAQKNCCTSLSRAPESIYPNPTKVRFDFALLEYILEMGLKSQYKFRKHRDFLYLK